MLTPKQLAEFDRDGCLIGGRVLDEAQVEELRAELDRILAIKPEGFAPGQARPVLFRNISGTPGSVVWQIVNIWEASPAFERLLYHPFVTTAISQMCRSGDIRVWHDQVQYKPSGTGGVNMWHQDAPYWPVIKPETPVSAWIALDDVDEANGCMSMVPGSHKWGNNIKYLHSLKDFREMGKNFTPPADAEINRVEVRLWPVKKGEVSFHHSMTWHGSHENKSGRPRRAIAIHFMTQDARFVAEGEHPMKAFIALEDNALMAEAGAHFPLVCKNGTPVAAPTVAFAR
ncbi:MAG: phytanoyl-CoA dioxygenase family protein [Planctomycetota bacterium]